MVVLWTLYYLQNEAYLLNMFLYIKQNKLCQTVITLYYT
jgi:hypothetical protein